MPWLCVAATVMLVFADYLLLRRTSASDWAQAPGFLAAHGAIDLLVLGAAFWLVLGTRGRSAPTRWSRTGLTMVLLLLPLALLRSALHAGFDGLALVDNALSESSFCTFASPPETFVWTVALASAVEQALVGAAALVPMLALASLSQTPNLMVGARRWVMRLAPLALVMCGSDNLALPEPVFVEDPCAGTGTERAYNVSAIHVEITLNRWGDRDPDAYMYVLDERLADVRAQEATALPDRVSHGLRKDAIQPLVLRANLGECLVINFTNQLDEGPASLHINGLAHTAENAGGYVGNNPNTFADPGDTITYRIPLPTDPSAEHAYYFHDHGASRPRLTHGLFGSIVAEPAGSVYRDPETGDIFNGNNWEAIIDVPEGEGDDFREFVLMYHEVGDENFDGIVDGDGRTLPVLDELSQTYRPAARAINYRSEPFRNRLRLSNDKSQGYGSYMFGDPATPIPRSYLGEPTKTRLLHGGSEVFHVHHLHGGADRWRRNPGADPANDISSGLNKFPVQNATSVHLDSQSIGPGTSYDLEHECGAGGCQQAAGDFLYHCHIGHHYLAGMWSFWRVFDTKQDDLATLPGMADAPEAVSSLELLGKKFEGKTLVQAADLQNPESERSLEDWVESQLPPQGVRLDAQDATVWDWDKQDTVDGPLYLGEPETDQVWADYASPTPGERPQIAFNPNNGRYAWPLFRPHLGKRPPFAGNGHSGAPWLGEHGSDDRPDGLCPTDDMVPIQGRTMREYPITAITLPIQIAKNKVDPDGMIFVLSEDKEAVYAGEKPAQPLAIRSNVGDCTRIIFTSEMKDVISTTRKTNMHTHFVQFDPQASDGVITGFSYEQSVRPYNTEDRWLANALTPGATTVEVNHVERLREGIYVGVGLAEGMCGDKPCTEIRKIASIEGNTITLDRALENDHSAGEALGVEFVQYNWYSDIDFGTVFWHDHVNFVTWDHGLFGSHIVEPAGSTYHDPQTGEIVRSGTIVDIHAPADASIGAGQSGSFREFVVFQHNLTGGTEGQVTEGASFNLRAEPVHLRDGDPAHMFSSVKHGDPLTPLPRAYLGDPMVIRNVSLVERVNGVRLTGHPFRAERWSENGALQEVFPIGISERFDFVFRAGGEAQKPGDYLYYAVLQRDLVNGAWGLLRVHDSLQDTLQPLPGLQPRGGDGFPTQSATGEDPIAASGPGDVCPADAFVRSYAIRLGPSTIVLNDAMPLAYAGYAYTLDGQGGDDTSSAGPVVREPLVLRVNHGECLEVELHNDMAERASFHAANMAFDPQGSYGAAIGYNEDSSVAPGESRIYRFYAAQEAGSSFALNLADPFTASKGAFAGVVVEPAGSEWRDPYSGELVETGCIVDVLGPEKSFREVVALFHDDDPIIGQNRMPYHEAVEGMTSISYAAQPLEARGMGSDVYSTAEHGDPRMVMEGHRGDPVTFRVAQPWGEQVHVFTVGGHRWDLEPRMEGSQQIFSHLLAPGYAFDAELVGGLGGETGAMGDFLFRDSRTPFTEAGLWGIMCSHERDSPKVLPLTKKRGN